MGLSGSTLVAPAPKGILDPRTGKPVGSDDPYFIGLNNDLADKGFIAGWGLGRHVLGSNYFHYVRDPWGSYSEYSSDVDYIPVDHDWQAADHPPADSFYVWGPTPPEDFAFNHELTV